MPVISDYQSKLFKTAEESEKPEKAEICVPGTKSLPLWLTKGTYLRIGPSKFDFSGSGFQFNHWLDGYALLQRFEIGKDSIHFEKKYVESDAYKRGISAQAPLINEFATACQRDPNKGFFSRIVSNLLPEFTDNNYATIYSIADSIFVSCDTCFFRRVDGKTLETYEKCDGNKIFGLNGQSAHPLTDSNGDVYNVGFNLFPSAKYSFVKMPKASTSKEMMKKAKTIATFPSRWTGAIAINHSFGMSENYLLFIEQPYTVGLSKIASSVMRGDTLMDILEWKAQETNRFIIVEKSTGKIFKTDFMSAESFYFMHIINCFEEDNQIILDLISYKSPNVLESLFLDKLRAMHPQEPDTKTDLSCIQRFIIPLISDIKTVNEGVDLINKKSNCSAFRQGNKITLEGSIITKRGIEMPTINQKYFGKKIRYVYSSGTFNASYYSHSICKTDLLTNETKVWKDSEFLYPGEALFVPNPEGSEEDDGVVIVALTDSRSGHDDHLLFLDAGTFTELARANFKSHVPSALHGMFLPSS